MSDAPLPPPVGSDAEALARLRLARSEGIGPVGFRRLLAQEGSAAAALARLARRPVWGGQQIALPPPEAAAAEAAALRRLGGRFLFLGDADYPPRLAEVPDAPPILSVLGDPAILAAVQIGLVGARAASAASRRLAEDIAEDLAAAGIVVTSGLARGVDAAAHQGALRTGRTVAVVPGGLDQPYPPEHAGLQARIAQVGAVVAEAPLGAAPIGRHFPRRNRILAGLVVAVVVVEAAARSGTLITAREAADLGREVYAVPGHPVDPRSAGGNALIKQGAPLVENAEDILALLPPSLLPRPAALPPSPTPPPSPPPVSPDHQQILELIGETPVAVDELAARCHLAPSDLQPVLAGLELAGQVALLPGQRVVRRKQA